MHEGLPTTGPIPTRVCAKNFLCIMLLLIGLWFGSEFSKGTNKGSWSHRGHIKGSKASTCASTSTWLYL